MPGSGNVQPHLRAFVGALRRPDLPGQLEQLLALAVRAVPSCLGVSVVLRDGHQLLSLPALTVSVLSDSAGSGRALASMSVELPRPLADGHGALPAALVLYASQPLAFLAVAPSLLALLDLSHQRVALDAHLVLPDLGAERMVLAQHLAGRAVIGRAVGCLLDRGLSADEAVAEIRRLATVRQVTTVAAARQVVKPHDPKPPGRSAPGVR